MSPSTNQPTYDYDSHSQIAGPLVSIADTTTPYRIGYRGIMNKRDALKAFAIIALNITFGFTFIIWLLQPSHFIRSDTFALNIATIGIIFCIAAIEIFRQLNLVSLSLAVLLARDPIPVSPQKDVRVAFTTTIVPSKEPFEVVAKTLAAMKAVSHTGTLDVWLLDEGDDPRIKQICELAGIHHFSRKDVGYWNAKAGQFKTKSKHGNHNSWLHAHGHNYDVVLSVDPDHIPLPNFAERILGYFRDPDVAFVVGPQVYGNYDNFVTKGAESQSYLFQAAIQRGGNAYNAAMFVGTNHAYRVATWQQINGFQDSITEDMLTSMAVLTHKNPITNQYWKSVYTPDVLAVGEGPSTWTDFFTQQLRWSRGANEILIKNFFKLSWKLPIRKRLHYILLISYYPSVALSWILGVVLSILFLIFGLNGVHIPGPAWAAFYTDIAASQMAFYFWLRRYNVSPHEDKSSLGMYGMFMSLCAVPIYCTALTGAILRRKLNFVVTPKGDSTSPDSMQTFSKNIFWALVAAATIVSSLVLKHTYPGVRIWATLTLIVCLAPLFTWWTEQPPKQRKIKLVLPASGRLFNRGALL